MQYLLLIHSSEAGLQAASHEDIGRMMASINHTGPHVPNCWHASAKRLRQIRRISGQSGWNRIRRFAGSCSSGARAAAISRRRYR
jgi:hypothetical protein